MALSHLWRALSVQQRDLADQHRDIPGQHRSFLGHRKTFLSQIIPSHVRKGSLQGDSAGKRKPQPDEVPSWTEKMALFLTERGSSQANTGSGQADKRLLMQRAALSVKQKAFLSEKQGPLRYTTGHLRQTQGPFRPAKSPPRAVQDPFRPTECCLG